MIIALLPSISLQPCTYISESRGAFTDISTFQRSPWLSHRRAPTTTFRQVHRLSHITASFLCWWQFRHASSCTSAHPYPTPAAPPPQKHFIRALFIYLHKSGSRFYFLPLNSPFSHWLDPGEGKKKSDLFQRGLKLLHPHSIHPGVSVLKCELKSERGVAASEEGDGADSHCSREEDVSRQRHVLKQKVGTPWVSQLFVAPTC